MIWVVGTLHHVSAPPSSGIYMLYAWPHNRANLAQPLSLATEHLNHKRKKRHKTMQCTIHLSKSCSRSRLGVGGATFPGISEQQKKSQTLSKFSHHTIHCNKLLRFPRSRPSSGSKYQVCIALNDMHCPGSLQHILETKRLGSLDLAVCKALDPHPAWLEIHRVFRNRLGGTAAYDGWQAVPKWYGVFRNIQWNLGLSSSSSCGRPRRARVV